MFIINKIPSHCEEHQQRSNPLPFPPSSLRGVKRRSNPYPNFLDCFTFVRNDTSPCHPSLCNALLHPAIPHFATHSFILSSLTLPRTPTPRHPSFCIALSSLSSLVLHSTPLLCHPSFCNAKRQGIFSSLRAVGVAIHKMQS